MKKLHFLHISRQYLKFLSLLPVGHIQAHPGVRGVISISIGIPRVGWFPVLPSLLFSDVSKAWLPYMRSLTIPLWPMMCTCWLEWGRWPCVREMFTDLYTNWTQDLGLIDSGLAHSSFSRYDCINQTIFFSNITRRGNITIYHHQPTVVFNWMFKLNQ